MALEMEAPSTMTATYSLHTGLSKSWKTVRSHTGIYTGGKVQVFTQHGRALMACMLHDDIAIVDAATGELQRTLQQDVEDEEHKEAFVVFAVRPQHNQLVTAGRNMLLRLWDLETFTCLRTIKAHQAPVLALDFDPSGTLLATGGSDRTVKVFDIDKGFCTHNFRRHSAIVTLVQFHPDPKRLQLVSCSDDTTVRIWDLYSQSEVACITDHVSPATCVAFSSDGYTMFTAGRDRIVNCWNLRDNRLIQTVVVHEAIEGIQVVPTTFACVLSHQQTADSSSVKDKTNDKPVYFVTAGEQGTLKLWVLQGTACRSIAEQALDPHTKTHALKYTALLLHAAKRELIAVTTEQNWLVFNDKLERTAQIIGFNDDILSLKYIPTLAGTPSEQLAVATNSEQIRLLNRQTLSSDLLSAHTDIVMALAVSPDGKWLVSASKDRTARLWDLSTQSCIATCRGHAEALSSIAISQKAPHFAMGVAFFVTGSADKTIKMWSLKPLAAAYKKSQPVSLEIESLITLSAAKAHDKDVNALAVAPNDRLVASASQDKLIKIWATNDNKSLTCIGTCRGHRRGVWAVEFSPVDQCLASASGDKTIKVWSAKDFSCLKTLEGHTASVLNVQFVCAGMQLVSAGADGLLKLWTIKSSECEATLDQHEDKIWALAAAKDSSEIASGGADSTIHLWHDCTADEEREAKEERDAKVLKEQQLFNCLRNEQLLDAVQLAFELGHPNRLLGILIDLLQGPRYQDFPTLPGSKDKPDFETFKPEQVFSEVVSSLSPEQLKTLLDWIKDWNTNAKHTAITQVLLSTILRAVAPETLKKIENVRPTLDALIAYSERHFQRMDRLLQKSYLVDFSVVSMKSLLPVTEADDDATTSQDADMDGSDEENENKVETKSESESDSETESDVTVTRKRMPTNAATPVTTSKKPRRGARRS